MNTYRLTAAFLNLVRVVEFEDESDSDAAFSALNIILDRAVDDLVWASGQVLLTNADTGEVLHKMEQKV